LRLGNCQKIESKQMKHQIGCYLRNFGLYSIPKRSPVANCALAFLFLATSQLYALETISGAPTITLSATDSIAAESSGTANTATVTLTRSGDITAALDVGLLFSGVASNGADFSTVAASVTIPAGQATATVLINPIDDTLVEGAESLAVRLSASPNYIQGAPNALGVLINDNDNATPLTTTGIVFATHTSGANTRDVKLNVYRPSTGSGPWPVLLYFPGGGWVSQNEGGIAIAFTNLTAHGYAVVSANYVTSSFAKWPAQIQDAKAAVRWVRANAATYGFDASRIAVAGTSSGGHIAAYIGASGGRSSARIGNETIDLIGGIGGNFNQSDVVQAAAPFYPPTDLLVMDHYPTPDVSDHNGVNSPESQLIGFPIQTVPEKTATANPLIFTRPNPLLPNLPPFWIVHGTQDRSVGFNQSERFHAALISNAHTSTFWPVLGAGHGMGVVDSQEVHSFLRAFLDRTLRGITINAPPVARFTASASSGPAPLSVSFDGTTSSDSDGVITKFSWSSGDGTGGGNASLNVTYSRPGIYPVTLAVRDDQGATHSSTIQITVSPAGTPSASPPTASVAGPSPNANYAPTGDLLLEAAVTANPGTAIASVEFFLSSASFNNQVIAWDSKAPYNHTIGGLPPGNYSASVRVSDVLGASTMSASVPFTVQGCDLFCSGFE
jgi:acetyl esterase/lipase